MRSSPRTAHVVSARLGLLCILLSLWLGACQGSIDSHAGAPSGQDDAPAIDDDRPEGDLEAAPDQGVDQSDSSDHADPSALRACLKQEFSSRTWPGVIEPKCAACHLAPGAGAQSAFELLDAEPSERNLEATRAAILERSLLVKALGGLEHGGGAVLKEGSEAHRMLSRFALSVEQPESACEEPVEGPGEVEIEVMDALQTYRKIALSVGGRVVREEERELLVARGEEALGELIDGVLAEPGFFLRLRETYNDMLLTDAALVDFDSHPGVYLDKDHFPDRDWYARLPDQERDIPSYGTRVGVTRGPLELIVHVVRQGLPFTEIVTADYIMMNAYAARSYGVYDPADFERPGDLNEYRPVKLAEDPLSPGSPYPTAGVLSNDYYLHRYPSTQTNRNRARARMVYQHFLNTDIMDRSLENSDPTDAASVEHPVIHDPQCAMCHNDIDPVAGLFRNVGLQGHRRPTPEGWYEEDMLKPGYNKATPLPEADRMRSLPWLGEQIAKDERFIEAAAAHAFQLVFARAPVSVPRDAEAPGFTGRLAVYEREQRLLRDASLDFVERGLDFRVLVKHLLLTPDYRARSATATPGDEAAEAIAAHLGAVSLATPEQLDRRLTSALGTPWEFRQSDHPFLNARRFLLLYGGIDSDSMTVRIREPSALMGGIIELMANDVGCRFAGRELHEEVENNRGWQELLPGVSASDVPSDPQGEARIREAIEGLHLRLLGPGSASSPGEIEFTYELFVALHQQGLEGIERGEISKSITNHCGLHGGDSVTLPRDERSARKTDDLYTVRAWAGVLSYLLQSYDFLYE